MHIHGIIESPRIVSENIGTLPETEQIYTLLHCLYNTPSLICKTWIHFSQSHSVSGLRRGTISGKTPKIFGLRDHCQSIFRKIVVRVTNKQNLSPLYKLLPLCVYTSPTPWPTVPDAFSERNRRGRCAMYM